jgi:hypothetical protein
MSRLVRPILQNGEMHFAFRRILPLCPLCLCGKVIALCPLSPLCGHLRLTSLSLVPDLLDWHLPANSPETV